MEIISPIKYLSLPEIEKKAKESKAYVVVILDDWCPASQEYKPIVEFFAEKYEDKLDFYIMRSENLNELKCIQDFGSVSSIPYTFFILGKTILTEFPGARSFNCFKTAVSNMLNFEKHSC
jgi:thiol-disulfide isomerase/thioredoxin